ncbi:hypothetical protein JCM10213_006171 [Rhodosporidiobolus nylandii]
MTSRETGECCVCGKETADRCGACAEADFALFFCSRDHQKLIWPIHKLVCGKEMFSWPPLTKEEVAKARLLLDVPLQHGVYRGKTLAQTLHFMEGHRSWAELFAALAGWRGGQVNPPFARELVICTIRSFIYTYDVKPDSDNKPDSGGEYIQIRPHPPTLLGLPFPFYLASYLCLRFYAERYTGARPRDLARFSWWNQLHHHFLVVSVLLFRAGNDASFPLPQPAERLQSLMTWARDALPGGPEQIQATK